MTDSQLFTLIFTGTWCLVGAIFLAVGIGLRRSFARREERLRARSAGTVVEVVRRAGRDSAAFYPIVEFEADGRRLSLECADGGGRKAFYEGQSVEVLYDPDDPACFRLEGLNPVGLAGNVLLWVGLGCVAVGVVAAVVVSALSGSIHFNAR